MAYWLATIVKPETQSIFATHNVNFPVLGDAEQILPCEFINDKIDVLTGSTDNSEIQDRIVNVMEEGSRTFSRSETNYNSSLFIII